MNGTEKMKIPKFLEGEPLQEGYFDGPKAYILPLRPERWFSRFPDQQEAAPDRQLSSRHSAAVHSSYMRICQKTLYLSFLILLIITGYITVNIAYL